MMKEPPPTEENNSKAESKEDEEAKEEKDSSEKNQNRVETRKKNKIVIDDLDDLWTLGNNAKMNFRKRDPANTRPLVQRRSISARSVTSRLIARASSLVTCSNIATHGRTSAQSALRALRLVRIFLGIWKSTMSPRNFTRARYATSRHAQNRI